MLKLNAIMVLSFLTLVTLAGSGCSNTLDGMGRDMEHAGQTVQETF